MSLESTHKGAYSNVSDNLFWKKRDRFQNVQYGLFCMVSSMCTYLCTIDAFMP